MFTPLTIVMLLVLLAAFATAGTVVGVDRNLLILMDLILVLVLGLVLYAISARDPHLPADLFDRLQLVLILSALAVAAAVAVPVAQGTKQGNPEEHLPRHVTQLERLIPRPRA